MKLFMKILAAFLLLPQVSSYAQEARNILLGKSVNIYTVYFKGEAAKQFRNSGLEIDLNFMLSYSDQGLYQISLDSFYRSAFLNSKQLTDESIEDGQLFFDGFNSDASKQVYDLSTSPEVLLPQNSSDIEKIYEKILFSYEDEKGNFELKCHRVAQDRRKYLIFSKPAEVTTKYKCMILANGSVIENSLLP